MEVKKATSVLIQDISKEGNVPRNFPDVVRIYSPFTLGRRGAIVAERGLSHVPGQSG